MGQRLNIEIVRGNECIANAYYHWSAYTSSAIRLTEQIIDFFEDNAEDDFKSKVEYAVRALETTGAGINDSEKNMIELTKDFGFKFKHCIGRKNGLISVTEPGIHETEQWDEGRVTIDPWERTVLLNVYSVDPVDVYEEESGCPLPTKTADASQYCEFRFADIFAVQNFVEENVEGWIDCEYVIKPIYG